MVVSGISKMTRRQLAGGIVTKLIDYKISGSEMSAHTKALANRITIDSGSGLATITLTSGLMNRYNIFKGIISAQEKGTFNIKEELSGLKLQGYKIIEDNRTWLQKNKVAVATLGFTAGLTALGIACPEQSQWLFEKWLGLVKHPVWSWPLAAVKFALLGTLGEILGPSLKAGKWVGTDKILQKIGYWAPVGLVVNAAFMLWGAGTGRLFTALGLSPDKVDIPSLKTGLIGLSGLFFGSTICMWFYPWLVRSHVFHDMSAAEVGKKGNISGNKLKAASNYIKAYPKIWFNIIRLKQENLEYQFPGVENKLNAIPDNGSGTTPLNIWSKTIKPSYKDWRYWLKFWIPFQSVTGVLAAAKLSQFMTAWGAVGSFILGITAGLTMPQSTNIPGVREVVPQVQEN